MVHDDELPREVTQDEQQIQEEMLNYRKGAAAQDVFDLQRDLEDLISFETTLDPKTKKPTKFTVTQEASKKPRKRVVVVRRPKTKPKVSALVSKPSVVVTERIGVRSFDGKSRRTTWLWDKMVPLGEITILAGPKGTGKTQILLDLVSKLSRGKLEGEFFGKPMESLVFCLEDSEDRVTKPRLQAAGFKQSRVHAPNREYFPAGFKMADRLEQLRETLQQNPNIKLVVVDTLTQVMTAKERGYDGVAARELLTGIRHILDDFEVAMVATMHVVKSARVDPTSKILGSVEVQNVARSILQTEKFDRDDYGSAACVLSQTSSNLGPQRETSIAYQIIGVENVDTDSEGMPVNSSKVEILNSSEERGVREISLEQVSSPTTRNREPSPCVTWLKLYLEENGETKASEIAVEAADRGFSRATVFRAKDTLKLTSRPSEENYKEKLWKLPS